MAAEMMGAFSENLSESGYKRLFENRTNIYDRRDAMQ